MIAEFSFSGSKTPKAILVLVPGSNTDGRYLIRDNPWVNFQKQYDLLLVGCLFRDDIFKGDEDYCNMRKGAGDKLLMAITAHLGLQRPELWGEGKEFDLAMPPIYIWGFSAGGQFAYEFACHYPYYTAAFVANKGGVYYTALAPESARKVPGLLIAGLHDAPWRRAILKGIHALNTNFGSKWHFIEEPYGHSEGDSAAISVNFFSQLLERGNDEPRIDAR